MSSSCRQRICEVMEASQPRGRSRGVPEADGRRSLMSRRRRAKVSMTSMSGNEGSEGSVTAARLTQRTWLRSPTATSSPRVRTWMMAQEATERTRLTMSEGDGMSNIDDVVASEVELRSSGRGPGEQSRGPLGDEPRTRNATTTTPRPIHWTTQFLDLSRKRLALDRRLSLVEELTRPLQRRRWVGR